MILKTRDFSLPAMVNVFALSSVAEIVPRKGTVRSDAFVTSDAVALGGTPTEFSVSSAADALAVIAQNANVAMQTGTNLDLCFMGGVLSDLGGAKNRVLLTGGDALFHSLLAK